MRGRTDAAASTSTPPTPDVSFEVFFESQWPATVRVVRALVRDGEVADELAQEAFLRAYARWRRVSRLDRPDLWVRRVALNLAVSRFRRVQAEARALVRLGARRGRASEQRFAPEVEDFWDAIHALPPRQAQVTALFYGDDLAVADIALVLGCAEGTVKAHLHAARQRLRDQFDPNGGDGDA